MIQCNIRTSPAEGSSSCKRGRGRLDSAWEEKHITTLHHYSILMWSLRMAAYSICLFSLLKVAPSSSQNKASHYITDPPRPFAVACRLVLYVCQALHIHLLRAEWRMTHSVNRSLFLSLCVSIYLSTYCTLTSKPAYLFSGLLETPKWDSGCHNVIIHHR